MNKILGTAAAGIAATYAMYYIGELEREWWTVPTCLILMIVLCFAAFTVPTLIINKWAKDGN